MTSQRLEDANNRDWKEGQARAVLRPGHTLTATSTLCDWFALCTNVAVGTKDHPILGAVQICERCREKIDRIEAATKSGGDA